MRKKIERVVSRGFVGGGAFILTGRREERKPREETEQGLHEMAEPKGVVGPEWKAEEGVGHPQETAEEKAETDLFWMAAEGEKSETEGETKPKRGKGKRGKKRKTEEGQ